MISLSYLVGGAIVSIEFDATIREEHQGTTTVTEHNVEVGANVSDHARPELRKITCDVCVSNTPIRVPLTNTDGVTGDFTAIDIDVPGKIDIPRILPGIGLAGAIDRDLFRTTDVTKVTVLNFGGPDIVDTTVAGGTKIAKAAMNRVLSVYNELEFLRTSSTLVTIDSFLQQYTNMVIKTVSAPRNVSDGTAMVFSFMATEIRFVESQIVAVKADVGVAKTTNGNQPTKKPNERQVTLGKAGAVKIGVSTPTARPLAPLN